MPRAIIAQAKSVKPGNHNANTTQLKEYVMYTYEMIEAAIAENASLAVQWEEYAVELFLQGEPEEDITLCLDEAQLHWGWVVAWQERQDNTLDALYEDFDMAGVPDYVPDYAAEFAEYAQAYELAQAYGDYPTYVW